MENGFKPAIVRYIGTSDEQFTNGQTYEAFFVEYWEGERNSLHVRGNNGRVTDFNPLEDFEIISDEDNLLNFNEATVRCITHEFDDLLSGVTYGEEYKESGRDKDGMYLVLDDSNCCYFYPASDFEIVADEHNILSRRSVYYSYNGGDEVKKYIY